MVYTEKFRNGPTCSGSPTEGRFPPGVGGTILVESMVISWELGESGRTMVTESALNQRRLQR